MLEGNLRYILYFDLAMVPYPSDAPALPLDMFIPHLDQRCADGMSFQVIDNERRIVRLSRIKKVSTAAGTPVIAFLFALGDRNKADPGFTNFKTGAVRIAKRREGEAGGLSVHAVISLDPTKPNGHLYRMVYEDVSGFGRTLIQNFLRSEFRVISQEQNLVYTREGGGEIKTRPLVELSGHASDKIRTSLERGTLLHIELVNYHEMNLGFDEQKYIQSSTRDLKLSISKGLPHSDTMNLLEKVKAYGRKNGYAAMRVRWRDPNKIRPESAKIDTNRNDAGEAVFVKSAEAKLKTSLPDISEEISDELIMQMKEMLE